MKRIILSEHYQFPPTITVSCSSSTRLTDIDNKLHDVSILAKQSPTVGVWFLNANLVIAKALTFSLPFLPTKVRPVQEHGQPGHTSLSANDTHNLKQNKH